MPGRKFSSVSQYRYGFNGKENDNEVKGEGNLQDYGMRIYDPRIGKFLSIDPLTKSYPQLTPYQFASNTPIAAIDLDGCEAQIAIGFFLGMIEELAEQTVSIVTENLENGRFPMDGFFSKIDVVDVLIGGVQGAATSVGVPNVGQLIISGMIGNAAKSAVDVNYNPNSGSLETRDIFTETKSQSEWASEMVQNTTSGLAGGLIPGTKSMLKKPVAETAEKLTTKVVSSALEGTRTGLVQGATILIVDEASKKKKTSTTQNTGNNSGPAKTSTINTKPNQITKPSPATTKPTPSQKKNKANASELKTINRTRSDGTSISVPDNEYGRKALKEFMKGG